MAFVPVPNVAMVELVYLWDSQVCENTLYFEGTVEWTSTDLITLADQVESWRDTRLKALQSTGLALTSVKATSLESQNAAGIEYTTGLPVAGTLATGTAIPNNVTAAIAFLTALRGRNYRGRNYVLGLRSTSLATGNTVAASVISSYEDGYDFLDVDVVVNGASHVVVSRWLNNVQRTTGVATNVIAYSMNATCDSMRRRLPERGQ